MSDKYKSYSLKMRQHGNQTPFRHSFGTSNRIFESRNPSKKSKYFLSTHILMAFTGIVYLGSTEYVPHGN